MISDWHFVWWREGYDEVLWGFVKIISDGSLTVRSDVRYFSVEFFESDSDICRNLFGEFDIGVGVEKDGYHDIFNVSQMDEILLVVEVDSPYIRVCFSLLTSGRTFWRLLWVWFSALISRAVVCTNFSFSFWGALWQMSTPSLSESMMPFTQWNSSIMRLRN